MVATHCTRESIFGKERSRVLDYPLTARCIRIFRLRGDVCCVFWRRMTTPIAIEYLNIGKGPSRVTLRFQHAASLVKK